MHLVLFSQSNLAIDALRVALLASQVVERVTLVTPYANQEDPQSGEHSLLEPGTGESVLGEIHLAPGTLLKFALYGVAKKPNNEPWVIAVNTMSELCSAMARLSHDKPATDDVKKLSRRETQVIGFLATGMTNREIAELLKISIKTVDTHRGQTLKKLGLRNNSDLTRFALRHGLVPQAAAA